MTTAVLCTVSSTLGIGIGIGAPFPSRSVCVCVAHPACNVVAARQAPQELFSNGRAQWPAGNEGVCAPSPVGLNDLTIATIGKSCSWGYKVSCQQPKGKTVDLGSKPYPHMSLV